MPVIFSILFEIPS